MYREYFGLRDNPFSIAPDPQYFYMSEGHREALAHLVYGVNSDGGFVLLTGEVGTGKTTACRCLLRQMPDDIDVAFILNPKLTVLELLETVCDEFGIAYPEGNTSNMVFVSRINEFLLWTHEKGRRAILIIEEAQNVSVEVLEQVRLLTNLETSRRKLLQVIMLGQPELREMLARPELRQLAQRITARYHLGPLKRADMALYINHRLTVAGLVKGELFYPGALNSLFRLTGGVPRLINVICDRALTGAFVQGKEQVDKSTLYQAAREVSGQNSVGRSVNRRQLVFLCGLLVSVFLLFSGYHVWKSGSVQRMSASSVSKQSSDSREGSAAEKGAQRAGSSLEKPLRATREGTRDKAYETLFGKWQITFDPRGVKDVCEQASTQGLRCLRAKSDLPGLIQINRPVVLKLHDEKRGEYFAALISLKGEDGVFTIDTETKTVNLKEELARRWSGDAVLLWHPPKGYKGGTLRPGDRGPLVGWLVEKLDITQGKTAKHEGKSVYDEEITMLVKRFQLSAGLVPNGIAGWRTIICLTDTAGDRGPTLHDRKGG